VSGEVITSPFTFPATYHVLMNLPEVTPVFADVSPEDFCLTPRHAAEAVTDRTAAVLATHAYGFPCDVEGLAEVAAEHRLKLVYDAAPAIGCRIRGASLAGFGDAAVLSFHATKALSTGEGGAIVCRDRETYERCRLQVNFGISGEESVELPGLNGKLDELRAAMGLLGLRRLDVELEARRRVVERYLGFFAARALREIDCRPGLYRRPEVRLGHEYFPVVVSPRPGLDRDLLCARLRSRGVIARKYYFPTVLDRSAYRDVPMRIRDCPAAAFLSRNVLCLPVNQHFGAEDCDEIIRILSGCLADLGVR